MLRKNANFNDLVDERYDGERRETRKNLIDLESMIHQQPKLFEYSFKRSLKNHLDEIKLKDE
jgi:hypothetical protein